MTLSTLPLAITMGDPAGIGPEIIAKLAATEPLSTPYVVIGDAGALARAATRLGLKLHIRELPASLAGWDEAWTRGETAVYSAGVALPADLPLGRLDKRAGAASYAWVVAAIDLALAGRIAGIVTAPLNKEAMRLAGIDYPGHTEILAARSGTQDFAMMLANDELRVILVSIHVSLRDAIDAATVENELRAFHLAQTACRALGIAKPRIAVAGLNPHAGENGLFGREDLDVIVPAIALAREQGLDVSGPWPGDTVFMRARRGEFDIVVAQYHDQGLIPVKYLGVDHGVNVTVGLPFIRTSVDHGTAFDIAGSGRAEHASLLYAFRQAEKMLRAQ
ncbi:4-hydroxythreonine-4-phosphate dehydrogenase PdxA [Serratia marcescens]|jgi:4-hydroxythreonine-4-phosphate dehydrogenase|uniref:4-hydroxythreonine-4-phosphate dehydrogenase PdxA n=1 Tax=Serratia marcescens TaxID=615 RepID=UPI0007C8C2B2|nr:4-hydroxythreonine-4-phosphate dehydrogenase PdxA [Serratia marcescens]MBH2563878.1 4-hydroxythreonine-4-phosphate dehydrogenase PdxA [Serratia marcescens]OAH28199.1 4-hydroxythreonine-4-phosphate dehydrogenase [Serratia marcescens]